MRNRDMDEWEMIIEQIHTAFADIPTPPAAGIDKMSFTTSLA